MPTDYPGGFDDFQNPSSSNDLPDPGVVHSRQHADVNDAVEAIEREMGLTPADTYTDVAERLDDMETAPATADLTLSYYNFDDETVTPVASMGAGGFLRFRYSSSRYFAKGYLRGYFGVGLSLPSVDPDDDNTALCIDPADWPTDLTPAVPPGDVDPTGEASWGGIAWISDPSKQPAERNYVGLQAGFSRLPVLGSPAAVFLFETMEGESMADPNQLVGNPQFSGGSVVSRVPFTTGEWAAATKFGTRSFFYERATPGG